MCCSTTRANWPRLVGSGRTRLLRGPRPGVALPTGQRSRSQAQNGLAPAKKPMRVRPISGTFRSALDPGFRRGDGGFALLKAVCRNRTWAQTGAGPGADVGRRRRGVNRESPDSVCTFAIIEPSKEPHDSLVPVFQWPTHGGVARGQAARSAAPRAHLSARPRGPPATKPARSLRSKPKRRVPREDGGVVLATVGTLRCDWTPAFAGVTEGVSSNSHGRSP